MSRTPESSQLLLPSCISSRFTMANLSKAEVDDVREVFEVFDFWDGHDGMVDASRVPDLLRCTGLNPTNACCLRNGTLTEAGECQYSFEEFLSVYQAIKYESTPPDKDMFMQVFKSYDRESQGVLSAAQIRHILETYGERLSESETDKMFELMGYQHGTVKYEELIDRILEETTEAELSE
ncbi:myosin essential light chain striated adductor [Echinococcus multilocularis]|uniref:Myosin essential light chain striated adductor n=1 Tax=Echinococcus multilocularis TaxID=6211 RepID=A0A068Y908_ECHMU|nr:myosin essential light chain striated adductor [Echinococcus multilocularis]